MSLRLYLFTLGLNQLRLKHDGRIELTQIAVLIHFPHPLHKNQGAVANLETKLDHFIKQQEDKNTAHTKSVNDLRVSFQSETAALKQSVDKQIGEIVTEVKTLQTQNATLDSSFTSMQQLFMLQFQELKEQNQSIKATLNKRSASEATPPENNEMKR